MTKCLTMRKLQIPFLLNNFHYIMKTMKQSKIWNLLTPQIQNSFISEYENLVGEQRSIYKASLKGAVQFLTIDEKLQEPKLKKTLNSKEKKLVKQKYEGFNTEIEELFSTLKLYVLPDDDLRKQIREDGRTLILPLYHEFTTSFPESMFTKTQGKYFRYSQETLDSMLQKCFSGEFTVQKKKLFSLGQK